MSLFGSELNEDVMPTINITPFDIVLLVLLVILMLALVALNDRRGRP
jgi:biopolymer transport protein ExbD